MSIFPSFFVINQPKIKYNISDINFFIIFECVQIFIPLQFTVSYNLKKKLIWEIDNSVNFFTRRTCEIFKQHEINEEL